MLVKPESKVAPLPDDDRIHIAEKYWHVKLPESYYKFLKRCNGGIPLNRVFFVGSRDYVIERFLSYMKDYTHPLSMYDINIVLDQVEDRLLSNEDTVGVELLPIAALFAGDLLCLDFRKSSTNPEVIVWDAHESTYLNPVTYNCCDSFDALTKTLQSIDDFV